MFALKHLLVLFALILTNNIFAQTTKEIYAKELSDLRLFCATKETKDMTYFELSNEIKKSKKSFASGEKTIYKFDDKSFLYDFSFDVQQGSWNRYIVIVSSDELDKNGRVIPRTHYSKTYYVNPIKRPPNIHPAYSHPSYNKDNTMNLTHLTCWLFEASQWMPKETN